MKQVMKPVIVPNANPTAGPVDLPGPAGRVSRSIGYDGFAKLVDGGAFVAWGNDNFGQLGRLPDGGTAYYSPLPFVMPMSSNMVDNKALATSKACSGGRAGRS